ADFKWRGSILRILALFALMIGTAHAETVTVDTYLGEVAVPKTPEKIVVLDLAAVDSLDALGVSVQGVPDATPPKYLQPAIQEVRKAGTLFEPNYETIAVMKPDLVIVGLRSNGAVEPLSAIAPTIDMTIEGQNMVVQAKARLAAYGQIFDLEEEAQTLITTLNQKIEEVNAAVQGRGKGLIILTNGGKISAYGKDSRFGWLHKATGLPEAAPGLTDKTHGEAISFEFIAETNPDWMLVVDRGSAIGQEGEAAQATLDNPLIAGTTAGQLGQIIYLDSAQLYLAGGGFQSMMRTLDEVLRAFIPRDS
ncbi:MAG: siderophore ABC transporter substrate-binding protein, partial [Pseudomonadota bacterium]